MEKKVIPLIILVIAFGARLAAMQLVELPLNWDEVSHGYNAYSILESGRDEWGTLLPLANFRAYGDYPLPLNMYLTVPFIAIFGLSEVAIRMPALILGSLTVLGVYFLTKEITKNEKQALIASFLLSISPWHVHPSRAVFQSTIALFFIVWGVYLIISSKKNSFKMPLGIISLGMSLYAYHNARIFIPLLFIGLIFLYRNIFSSSRFRGINTVLILIFFIPLIPILLSPEARARSAWVGIINESAINQINTNRAESELPQNISRLRYNKVTYFVSNALTNYVGYFSPKFLFLEGGTQYQFSVPGKGIMFPVEMVFFYLGFLYLIGQAYEKKEYKLLVLWLLLSPIPAAITQGGEHVIRASTMIPIPYILSAQGVLTVGNLINRKRLYFSFFALLVVIELAFLLSWFQAYKLYARDYSWAWQYGYKEVVTETKKHYSNYDYIIVTKKYGEPHEFFLFFWPWEPKKYRTDQSLIRFHQSNWYWVDRFNKFNFVNDWDIPREGNMFILESKHIINCDEARCLLITSPKNAPKDWKLINEVSFLNGETAFEFYEKEN